MSDYMEATAGPVDTERPQPLSRKAFFAAVGAAAVAGAAAAATAPAEVAEAAMTTALPWFNVRDYGAVGDGVADDAPAIQKALNAIVADSTGARTGVLYLPQGDYRVASRITGSSAVWRLTIRGDGMGVTRIMCTGSDGVFKIDSRQRPMNVITVDGISFFATKPACGAALEFTMPEGGGLHNRSLVVSHIEMRGVVANADYFDYGLRALGHWRPLVYDATFSGVFGPGTDATKPDDPHYFPVAAFEVDGSYAPAFHYCYAWSAQTGYKMHSEMNPGPEDASFYRAFAVECKVGIDLDTPHTDGEPQLEIDTLHVNCLEVGIRLRHRKYFQITNCLLYNNVFIGKTPLPYKDIELIECFGGIIEHTIFHQPTNPHRTMVSVDGGCFDIAIRNNLFNAAHTAVAVAEGAKNVRVIHNDFNRGVDPIAKLQLVSVVLDDPSGQVIFHSDELRAAVVHRTSALSVPADTWVTVGWQGATKDTAGFFDAARPNELVVPSQVGIRQIRVDAQVAWANSGTRPGWQDLEVLINGNPVPGTPSESRAIPVTNSTASDPSPMQVASGVITVKGGDRISVRARHRAGGTAQIQGPRTWLSVESVEG